jgi:hypothetical protein
MGEEIKQELQRKIAAKFEQAFGPKPPAPGKISEEERQARSAQYADLLLLGAGDGNRTHVRSLGSLAEHSKTFELAAF